MKNQSRSTHRPTAGSYVELFFAAIVMQILYFVTAIWSGSGGSEFYNSNTEEIHFALRIQLSLGWMMCIVAGLGFSILPLIYDLIAFEKTSMRTYVSLNISGQFAIMIGVVSGIIMNDLQIFQTLVTVGISLLCASLISLGPSAISIFKIKEPKKHELGPFTYSIGSLMPLLGTITISCWILRGRIERILKLSESIIFDFFLVLTVVTIIISHFNRRLNWNIIETKNLGKIFGIFTALLFVSVICEPLYYRDEISVRVFAVLVSAPFFFIFVMLNPVKLFKSVIQKKPHQKMILCAVLWMPVVGFTTFIETMGYVAIEWDSMPPSRLILIFGVIFQSLWGFAEYLHQDHKKLSIHRRRTRLLPFLSVNLGSAIIFISFISSWQNDTALQSFPRVGIIFFALAFILILLYWIKDLFFSLDDWHKIPMFYDKYLAYPEEGSGYEPTD